MRNNDIINSSYTIGVGTRNLVLNTLGRLYVKVQDRYYEIDFRNQLNETINANASNVITIGSDKDINDMSYPGDDKLIISEDGRLWITKNNTFKPIEFKINQNELVVNKITVNDKLFLNSEDINDPPIVINSNLLIKNLNAEFLNDLRGDDYGVKAKDEIITGSWQFNNLFVNNNIYGVFGGLNLDFNKNSIQVDELTVNNKVTLPDGVIPTLSEDQHSNYAGLKATTIWGKEIKFKSSDVTEMLYDSLGNFLQVAYDLNYLDNEVNGTTITYSQWYDVFYKENEETGDSEPVDIEIDSELISQKIIELGITDKTIDDYNLFLSRFKEVDLTDFNGSNIELNIPNLNEVPFGTIRLGDIVKFNLTGIIGKVINLTLESIVVKLQNESDSVNDNYIIILPEKGEFYTKVFGSSTPYLNISDNKTKVQIGDLSNISDLYKDKIGLYADEPYLKNVNIDSGNIKLIELTSGTISDSTLSIVTINDSTINKGTINNSSIVGGSITSANISESTLTQNTITDNTITQNTIDNNTIINGTIDSVNISNSNINNPIVTGGTFDALVLTNGNISESTLTNCTINNVEITSGIIEHVNIEPDTVIGGTFDDGLFRNGTMSHTLLNNVKINNNNFKYNDDGSGQLGDRISWNANGIVSLTVDQQEKRVKYINASPETIDALDLDVLYTYVNSYQLISIKPYSWIITKSGKNGQTLDVHVYGELRDTNYKSYTFSIGDADTISAFYTTEVGIIQSSLILESWLQ